MESRVKFEFESSDNNFLDLIRIMYKQPAEQQFENYRSLLRNFADICLVFINKGYDIYAGTSALDHPDLLEDVAFRTFAANLIYRDPQSNQYRSLYSDKIKIADTPKDIYFITHAFYDFGTLVPGLTMRITDERAREVSAFIKDCTIKGRYTLPPFLRQ